jgi:molybdate transport system ATP-binding protein
VNAFSLRGRYPGFTLDASMSWDSPATALFGASGSGKSTVLEALVGLRPEITGEITLGSRRLDGLPPDRRRLGWVPQEAALFPHLTVAGNLAFAEGAGRRARGEAASRERGGPAAERAVAALEIRPLLGRRADELSGGERQRVAIARALASAPDMLLLDEPLASVDRPLRARIVPFLRALPERTGVPVLLVSHDPHEVLALVGHVAVVAEGRIVEQGDPRDVLASGAALGALEALGAENLFEVTCGDRHGGMLRLSTAGGCDLEMALVKGFPEPERIAVRAEDIMLAMVAPERISAQNVIAGAIVALETLGEHVYVRIAVGDEAFVSKVTTRAVESLDLAPGRAVHLLIKAHAVHPYA